MLRPDRPLCPADAGLCIRELRFRMRDPVRGLRRGCCGDVAFGPSASRGCRRLSIRRSALADWDIPSTPTRSCGVLQSEQPRRSLQLRLRLSCALRQSGTPIALGFALTGAYAAYELVLFAATPILGSAGAFTLTIVGRLGVLSLLWLIELVAAYEVFRVLNPIRRRKWQMPRRLSWSKVTVGAIVGKIAAAELIKVGWGGRQSARSPYPLLRLCRCRRRRGGTCCTHSGIGAPSAHSYC